jgi:hypothetical protein
MVIEKMLKYCGYFKAIAAATPAVANLDIEPNESGFLPCEIALSNLFILKNMCQRAK